MNYVLSYTHENEPPSHPQSFLVFFAAGPASPLVPSKAVSLRFILCLCFISMKSFFTCVSVSRNDPKETQEWDNLTFCLHSFIPLASLFGFTAFFSGPPFFSPAPVVELTKANFSHLSVVCPDGPWYWLHSVAMVVET